MTQKIRSLLRSLLLVSRETCIPWQMTKISCCLYLYDILKLSNSFAKSWILFQVLISVVICIQGSEFWTLKVPITLKTPREKFWTGQLSFFFYIPPISYDFVWYFFSSFGLYKEWRDTKNRFWEHHYYQILYNFLCWNSFGDLLISFVGRIYRKYRNSFCMVFGENCQNQKSGTNPDDYEPWGCFHFWGFWKQIRR